MGFSPFQLVHRVEEFLQIECKIPSLKIDIELLPGMTELESHLVHLEHIDEKHHDASIVTEAHKRCVKIQYNKFVFPRIFPEGCLVLFYD